MVDPATAGLIGTGVGGFIGFAGVALTSWRTTKREERARLFTEKRKVYSSVLETLTTNEYRALRLAIDVTHDSSSANNQMFDMFQEGVIKRTDLLVIGSQSVREASEEYGKLWTAMTYSFTSFVGSRFSDEVDTEELLDRFNSSTSAVNKASSKLASAMRDDLGVPD